MGSMDIYGTMDIHGSCGALFQYFQDLEMSERL